MSTSKSNSNKDLYKKRSSNSQELSDDEFYKDINSRGMDNNHAHSTLLNIGDLRKANTG